MTQAQFNKFKSILQREIKHENLSIHEYALLYNTLGQIRRSMIDKTPLTIEENGFKCKKGFEVYIK